ncbi:hypothetical protein NA57DRAFT_68621 [Rhizodiscina lignyota]|uniref:Casein kinase II beta 2 subunit n=1 Tax=Rhizodiscina lignyota TaxID=1504668 RepID=A0A9P4I7J1_9PEZI|nr:hypothetical protein NA57DRAFT_68621 [Rhizodiscina lignyota]
MAPSSGALFQQLLGGAAKQIRLAWLKASRVVESQAPRQAELQAQVQPAYARTAPRHPIHPAAALRQSKGRWYTTHAAIKNAARNFTTSTSHASPNASHGRSNFPTSRVSRAISQLPGRARAPFASTLRPNLSGGTLGRTAGGYGFGSGRIGGQRYFSHAPSVQAQVVQNVSQGLRAFLIGGQKAQFDGVDPLTGNKRFKAVTALQKEASEKLSSLPRATPGSFIDFHVNPTITALTPLNSVAGFTNTEMNSYAPVSNTGLQTSGLLDVLSADFSRALKDLALILNDLKTISTLGDLPITYRENRSCLRIHFPGCDADTVEKLCIELGIKRGVVGQDPDFDDYIGTEIALLFPFAPSKTVSECSFFEKPVERRLYQRRSEEVPWRDMLSPSQSPSEVAFSTLSNDGLEIDEFEPVGGIEESNPWLSSPSGYESIESSHLVSEAADKNAPLEFQGFEGLYRFMEMCDDRRMI